MGSLSEPQFWSDWQSSYYQQHRVFVFINFSQERSLEKYHGKTVALNPNHVLTPFPALFLIQEMRTRGFHPWRTDRPIPQPLAPTYDVDDNSGEMADFGGVSDTGVGFGGSSGMAGPSGHGEMASSSSSGPRPPSTGTNQPSSAKRTTSVLSKVLKVSKSAFLRKQSWPL